MEAFDFGGFLGNVSKGFNLGGSPEEVASNLVIKNLKPTLAKVQGKASSQGNNPPVVAPTQYVNEQNLNNAVNGVSDFVKTYGVYLAVGAVALIFISRKI